MKLKNKLKLDLLKRSNLNKFEQFTNLIKLISHNNILNKQVRNNKGTILSNALNYNTKVKKTCLFTGRMRGNVTYYKMNRTQFKLLINNASINGIKLASW